MTDLPPELAHFASFLDAQPGPVQVAFQHCLAVMMVEASKAELAETRPGEQGAVCVFKAAAGDVFSVVKPQIEALLNEGRISLVGSYGSHREYALRKSR